MTLPVRRPRNPSALAARALLQATVCLLLASPLAAQTRAQQRQLQGYVPDGKPTECLTGSQVDQTRVLNNRTIDFILFNRQVYRNTLPSDCPGLGVAQAFQYATQTPNICNVDTIRVFQQGPGPRFGATCPLGMFQPMKPADAVSPPTAAPQP